METYDYKGLPITPAIIKTLIIEIFNGQTLKRDDIVKTVLEHHISKEGLRPEAQDFSRSVKKALSKMQRQGDASNRSYGYWEIHKTDAPVQIIETQKIEVESETIPTHTTFGEGDCAIYFYYFPSYKVLAQTQGKNSWPCKIGRTDRDPLLRILSQSSTALPEVPFVEFIIKTDDSSLLETVVHSVLTIRSRRIKNAPGVEWFDTNPEEVLDIIRFVKMDILDR